MTVCSSHGVGYIHIFSTGNVTCKQFSRMEYEKMNELILKLIILTANPYILFLALLTRVH